MRLPTLLLTAVLATTAQAQTQPTDAPANTKPLATYTAEGVQIYTCKDTPNGPAWTFTAPQATLFDHATKAGTHSAGPTWTLNDGSSVKGKLVASAPLSGPTAIPWLLLQSVDPKGSLAAVTYIRRTRTQGGIAPTTGCDAVHIGATSNIDYTATYIFYTTTQ